MKHENLVSKELIITRSDNTRNVSFTIFFGGNDFDAYRHV